MWKTLEIVNMLRCLPQIRSRYRPLKSRAATDD